MTPNDYHVFISNDEREAFMSELEGYRVWQEDADEDTLILQGHPGMGDVLREKFCYNFNECYNGTARDLWIEHSFENGVWNETYECDTHYDGTGYRTVTLDEFNELVEHLNEED